MLSGAGISVSAGIPDFRSPGGMYDTLRPDLLTATEHQRSIMSVDPTAVVSWDLFKVNQLPYLELRRPFILGVNNHDWKATLSHFFLKVLDDKGHLHRVYTQNIDGLDFQLAIDSDKIIPVHGSLGQVSCEACGKTEDVESFSTRVASNIKDIYGDGDTRAPEESTPVLCLHCKRPTVKPSTVLYGRQLPPRFFKHVQEDCSITDLLMVIGTSLTVYPAASLPELVSDDCVKVNINREIYSGGAFEFDHHMGGDCDAALLELIAALDWLPDIARYKAQMCVSSQKLLDACLAEAGIEAETET